MKSNIYDKDISGKKFSYIDFLKEIERISDFYEGMGLNNEFRVPKITDQVPTLFRKELSPVRGYLVYNKNEFKECSFIYNSKDKYPDVTVIGHPKIKGIEVTVTNQYTGKDNQDLFMKELNNGNKLLLSEYFKSPYMGLVIDTANKKIKKYQNKKKRSEYRFGNREIVLLICTPHKLIVEHSLMLSMKDLLKKNIVSKGINELEKKLMQLDDNEIFDSIVVSDYLSSRLTTKESKIQIF